MINYIQVYRPGYGVLAVGDQIGLQEGDTLLVGVSLKYTCAEDTKCHLRGVIGLEGEQAVANSVSVEVSLPASAEVANVEVPIPIGGGTILIPFPMPAPAPPAGTYNLGVYVEEDPDTYDLVEGCVVITEVPGMLDSVMMLMMMGLMMAIVMPMMSGVSEEVA